MPYSTACKTLSLTSLSKNDGSCSSGCDWADKKKINPAYNDHRHPVPEHLNHHILPSCVTHQFPLAPSPTLCHTYNEQVAERLYKHARLLHDPHV